MRCAPVAIFHLGSRPALIECPRLSARVTHCDPEAQSSCVVLNVWLAEIINNRNREGYLDALNSLSATERRPWHRLEKIAEIPEAEISSSGYTVHTLEAAAWSFLNTATFEDAVVRAANLGDDADTVAAVCRPLAGAHYRYSAIPHRWTMVLKDEERIAEMAFALEAAGKNGTRRPIDSFL